MGKIKVLEAVTTGEWSGVQKVVYEIVKGINEKYPEEFEFEILSGTDGRFISEIEKLNVKYHIIPELVKNVSPLNDLKAFGKIKKLINERKYDVLHFHTSKLRVLGSFAANQKNVKKVVFTTHGWWHINSKKFLSKQIFIFLERLAAKNADYLVYLCNREKMIAEQWKIGERKKYFIVENAISPFYNKKGKLRKILGVGEDVIIIGNVARLDPQKNPFRFLEVALELSKILDNVLFVWIGESVVNKAYGDTFKNLINSTPELKNKFKLLGFQPNAEELINDFNFLLLTSDEEAYPLTALEAIMNNVPVISTDVGCLREMKGVITFNKTEFVKKAVEYITKHSRKLINSGTEIDISKSLENFIFKYASIYKA
jgi:glycosyltransferase involved in cell wall biosynthesis